MGCRRKEKETVGNSYFIMSCFVFGLISLVEAIISFKVRSNCDI